MSITIHREFFGNLDAHRHHIQQQMITHAWALNLYVRVTEGDDEILIELSDEPFSLPAAEPDESHNVPVAFNGDVNARVERLEHAIQSIRADFGPDREEFMTRLKAEVTRLEAIVDQEAGTRNQQDDALGAAIRRHVERLDYEIGLLYEATGTAAQR